VNSHHLGTFEELFFLAAYEKPT